MNPMTPHNKECALACGALRLERAIKEHDRKAIKEWHDFIKEIEAAPLDLESPNC